MAKLEFDEEECKVLLPKFPDLEPELFKLFRTCVVLLLVVDVHEVGPLRGEDLDIVESVTKIQFVIINLSLTKLYDTFNDCLV